MNIKKLLRTMFDLARLSYGGAAYLISGNTPSGAYQSMVSLFCSTGGASNDLMSSVIRSIHGQYQFPTTKGVLGNMSGRELSKVKAQLEEHGYCVFEKALPEDVCNRLLSFALNTPCSVRGMPKVAGTSQGGREGIIYDRQGPIGVRYDFRADDVINNADVQLLMADPSILSVAQAYLGSKPIADVTNMWWHTAYSDQPDEDAAQLFHFDMDRIRWLKLFIYLTDVGPDSGAHCFVEGSHRTGGIPTGLLSKGYARLTDEEISQNYPADKVIEFSAPAGTIILEDTRGLHKGKVVRCGDRLMLQIQFSNSLFGGTYPPSKFQNIAHPELMKRVRENRSIYVNYLS